MEFSEMRPVGSKAASVAQFCRYVGTFAVVSITAARSTQAPEAARTAGRNHSSLRKQWDRSFLVLTSGTLSRN